MQEFGKNKNFIRRFSGPVLSWLIFAAVLVIFLIFVNRISATTTEKQEEALKSALDRAIINCYCVEGTYPPSLDYIEEHYGLTYDEDLFFVDYRAIGSNMLPDVTVIRKEE